MVDESEDPLSRLEARLDRASEVAEQLIAEAAAAAVRKPPPSGWQRATEETEPEQRLSGELELLLEAVYALRERLPPDLQRRLGEALRELLLAVRALIDWYLERTNRQRSEPAEVQDIPIA